MSWFSNIGFNGTQPLQPKPSTGKPADTGKSGGLIPSQQTSGADSFQSTNPLGAVVPKQVEKANKTAQLVQQISNMSLADAQQQLYPAVAQGLLTHFSETGQTKKADPKSQIRDISQMSLADAKRALGGETLSFLEALGKEA